MANLITPPAYKSRTIIVEGALFGAVVVAGLYWAQPVLIPIALAVFLTFPLSPVVSALERLRFGRVPSVALVVLCAFLVLGGVAWIVNVQITSLVNELPTYTENVQDKIKYLRQMGRGVGSERLERFAQDIIGEWTKDLTVETSVLTSPEGGPSDMAPESSPEGKADSSESPTWLSRIPAIVGPVMNLFAHLALALVLVVFMLLEREALRDRIISLLGNGRMTAAIKALDDAGTRIGRYLLTQLGINCTHGIVWGFALYCIGVDYAMLWGFLAAVLRYVPFLGATIAALFPIGLSLAQFPGWSQPLMLIGILIALELVSNNVMEPWLYGRSIGVSAVAMVIAAAFWTFLWGPIGLILSGPMTVCLVVLGKHVPELNFFALLLGDAPALDKDLTYYQRLLAQDQDEAAKLVLAETKNASPEQVYDELLVPGLVYTKRDRERGQLTESDQAYVYQATHELLEDLGERQSAAIIAVKMIQSTEERQPPRSRMRILACPARDQADRLALEMLSQLLNQDEWDVEITALETLTAELVAHVTEEKSTLICIGALPPGGLAHTRYLCKRLRARHPALKIIVGRWGLKDDVEANREQLHDVGADLMATTLLETRKQLNDWLPVLSYEEARTAAGQ
jgi:predicted PurR-regulated permease PerM